MVAQALFFCFIKSVDPHLATWRVRGPFASLVCFAHVRACTPSDEARARFSIQRCSADQRRRPERGQGKLRAGTMACKRAAPSWRQEESKGEHAAETTHAPARAIETGSFKHRATMLPAQRAAAIMPSAHNPVPDAA